MGKKVKGLTIVPYADMSGADLYGKNPSNAERFLEAVYGQMPDTEQYEANLTGAIMPDGTIHD